MTLLAAVLLAAALAGVPSAVTHSSLLSSFPVRDATVGAAPRQVQLHVGRPVVHTRGTGSRFAIRRLPRWGAAR